MCVMVSVQVYDGSKANWQEDDPCHPVNAYGRSKLEAEQLIQVNCCTGCLYPCIELRQIIHCSLFTLNILIETQ